MTPTEGCLPFSVCCLVLISIVVGTPVCVKLLTILLITTLSDIMGFIQKHVALLKCAFWWAALSTVRKIFSAHAPITCAVN